MNSNRKIDKFKKLFNDFKLTTIKKISLVKGNTAPKLQKGVQTLMKMVNVLSIKAKAGLYHSYKTMQPIAHRSLCKAEATLYIVKPIVIRVAKAAGKQIQTTSSKAFQVMDKGFEKVHFNFRHFVATTGTAVLVFALTFTLTGINRSKVQAETLEVPTVETYNEKAVDLNYGDDSVLIATAKDILKDEVSSIHEAKAVTLTDGTTAYELGDYIVKVDAAFDTLEEVEATMTIETKAAHARGDFENTLVADKTADMEVSDAIAHEYKIKVNVVDNEAPVVRLNTAEVEIDDVNGFYPEKYIESIQDNFDGTIEGYTTEGEIESIDEDYWKPGTYTITYKATDLNGNVGTAALNVKVNDTKEEEIEEVEENEVNQTETGETTSTGGSAPDYANAGSIASAALAQLGVGQDCTMLVTNALRAVGIYHHGWPASYMSLGTIVSADQAQPGDIIYYDNAGAGVPHVAIYIGNGQAVHGGWNGGTTVIASAYLGSGPVFVRVR